ncbi:ABC-F type ribosomal protection protein [Bacillus sp. Gen3]|uniref:ribosomal protection-like ABC-F family protein n=1 Tax=Heyndrickxia oleronia TaxID=38875 RepID=UPI0015D4053A|nr:ABC-F type ribosomal protection protein [Heyndrickxia oleronia]MBU5211333.1 ABC-F type ribosomal protection protein [Heyndrickxia oleronia]NYV68780.1 ABC-F type ribosomal protection protein [Bacillus sp. Gen3]
MFLLKAEDVSIEINANTLFEKASLEICEGERIALIGNNGVGKTTFIKGLMGVIPITKGIIQSKLKANEVGWMDQVPIADGQITMREFIEKENEKLYELKRKLKKYETESNFAEDYMENFQQYLDLNGYDWQAAIDKQLYKVGLPEQLWAQSFLTLSGGQKTRAKLARVMVKQPKLLILDEPTNHLDAESIDWLVHWISQYKGAVLFTSHEREFIDRVATVTYELTNKGTKKYEGGYSFYREQKQFEQKTLEAQYQKQETERKKLAEAVNQYRQWFEKAHAAASERDPFAKKKANKNMTRLKAKEKALERLENNRVEKPVESKKLNYSIDAEEFSSRTMLALTDVSFSYSSELPLFDQLSLIVKRGDRIAIIGQNGTGKTTLLKLLTGKLEPCIGEVKRNPQLKIGYFMQELEGLNGEKTILEQILSLPNMTQTEARTILACFLFHREDVFKKVKDLSMGEKCRVAFVKLYFSQANLLIFDEPTNYLDIETRERIEEALAMYPGAVIMVSHDSFLLRKVANRVIALGDGETVDYPGTYDEWTNTAPASNELQKLNNEKSILELQLTNLIAEEAPDDQQQKEIFKQKLMDLKQKIAKLDEEYRK